MAISSGPSDERTMRSAASAAPRAADRRRGKKRKARWKRCAGRLHPGSRRLGSFRMRRATLRRCPCAGRRGPRLSGRLRRARAAPPSTPPRCASSTIRRARRSGRDSSTMVTTSGARSPSMENTPSNTTSTHAAVVVGPPQRPLQLDPCGCGGKWAHLTLMMRRWPSRDRGVVAEIDDHRVLRSRAASRAHPCSPGGRS